MRHVCLLDNKITLKEYEAWEKEDTDFWKEFIGITPTYELIRIDFSDYPTYIDEDGDKRPTGTYLKSLNDMAVAKYGAYGMDFIMMFVHSDNWQSGNRVGKGMWGTNYSYKFGKQCFEYCRWDKKNPANTFGTAYHERHHAFDAVIKTELGINIEPILGVEDYDNEITHGKSDEWDYIRWKENTDSLKTMKPYLLKAFSLREQKHEEVIKGYLRQIIELLTYLYRRKRK